MQNITFFDPKHWNELDRFYKFHTTTYKLSPIFHRAISGARNHLVRANSLRRLADKYRTSLAIDSNKNNTGRSIDNTKNHELTTIVESFFLSLYSAVDCTCKGVIFNIYNNKVDGISKSTRQLFTRASDNKIGTGVPQVIMSSLREASWYSDFMKLRDEITHLDVGYCFYNNETKQIAYCHQGLKSNNTGLLIDDIYERMNKLFDNVYKFLMQIYGELNKGLENKEIKHLCGFFNNHIYQRNIRLSETDDFNSGHCASFHWFEKNINLSCPFVSTCGAYKRAKL